MTQPKVQFMLHRMDMATMGTHLLRDHRVITSMVENVSEYSVFLCERFEVSMTVPVKVAVLWDVTPWKQQVLLICWYLATK
jgi:hypothetical protein